jgi:hypothetical protein
MFVGVVIFWSNRKVKPIQGRYPGLVMFSDFIVGMFVFLLCVQRFVPDSFSCSLSILAGHFFLLSIFHTYLTRVWLLVFDFTLQKLKVSGLDLSDEKVRQSNFFLRFQSRYRDFRLLFAVTFIATAILMIPAIIRSSAFPAVISQSNLSCKRDYADIIIVIYILCYVIAFVSLAFYLRTVQENFYIKAELRGVAVVGLISAIIWIALIYLQKKDFSASTLVLVLIGLWAFSTSTFMPWYFTLERTKKQAATIGADNFPDLKSVLAHPQALIKFTEFLQREFSIENLQFYTEVQAFKKLDPTASNVKAIKSHSSMIIKIYVAPGCVSQVNLDYKVVDDLIKANTALANGGDIDLNFYDHAADAIFSLMERDSFPRFKCHPLFADVLNPKSRKDSKATLV